MNTTARVRCQFSLPEFHRDRVLEWKLHVTQDLGAYDMILGRDVLSGLGIRIDFANNLMEWDSVAIPMKEADANICEAFNLQEPATVISATDRFKGILEAKYERADLAEVVKEAVHLTAQLRIPPEFRRNSGPERIYWLETAGIVFSPEFAGAGTLVPLVRCAR